MDASRSLSATPIGVPSGAWRWAAIAFGLLAFAAAVIAVVMPQTGVAGFAVLIGIALISLFLIYAIWPRGSRATQDALRVAEAAAKANVAWAITGDKAEFKKLADDVYAYVGKLNDANALVIVTSQGVILADTGNNQPDRAMPAKAAPAKKPSRSCRGSRSSPPCARCPTSRPPGGSPRAWPPAPRPSRS